MVVLVGMICLVILGDLCWDRKWEDGGNRLLDRVGRRDVSGCCRYQIVRVVVG